MMSPHKMQVLAALAVIPAITMRSHAQSTRTSASACAEPTTTSVLDDSLSGDLASATFDAVVKLVGQTHFDSTAVGAAWLIRANGLKEKAAASRTADGLRGVIRELLAPIGGSHMQILPKKRDSDPSGKAQVVSDGDIGLQFRVVENQLMVSHVRAAGAAARSGLRTGWIVRTIDGCAPGVGGPSRLERARVAERAMRNLRGPSGSDVTLEVLDGSGRLRTVTIARETSPGRLAELPNLPSMRVDVTASRQKLADGGSIGILRFDAWYPVLMNDLSSALDGFADADAVVLDMRGNTGGVATMYPWLAGFFLPSQTYLGSLNARAMRQRLCAFTGVVERAPYLRPLAILIDGHSHSTTEMFVASLQSVRRARVFGDTSLGGVVGAVYDRLPDGDVLEHPVVDFVAATGSRPEGTGVVPDERVPLRRADMLAGRDAAMARAITWITRETRRPSTWKSVEKCAQ